jgi:hypothetical protein
VGALREGFLRIALNSVQTRVYFRLAPAGMQAFPADRQANRSPLPSPAFPTLTVCRHNRTAAGQILWLFVAFLPAKR